jgi:hypothetical protein
MAVEVHGQPGAEREPLLSRLQAELDRAQALHAQAQVAVARARELASDRQRILDRLGEPVVLSQELLEWSPYARLAAQVASRPVIEQAKGILMAQAGCTDQQAFTLLRRASQRANVPVRELAERIVARAAQGDAGLVMAG